MQDWWMAQQVAEEHRRDLASSARSGTRWDGRRTDRMVNEAVGPDNERVRRRAIAPSVGALLIRMGTRLGGTSMRTS